MSENQEYKPVEMDEAIGVPLVGKEVNTVESVLAVPMIEVVAPATLPEGYAFEAQVGDSVFTITVVSCVGLQTDAHCITHPVDVQDSCA
jgi:hypothetical protein